MSNAPGREALENVHVAILAGGSGTRLWPRSRQSRPKQFLNLVGPRSMLVHTVERVLPLVPLERIHILTGPEHAPLVAEQLPDLPPENIMVEPSPKGTAPCLGLAALRLFRRTGRAEDVMVSLHADHVVALEERFRDALRAAVAVARDGHIVTIGIIPAYPETGFGYIERAEPLPPAAGQEVYRVARFTEKPPPERARQFVESGRYYWNTGYFAWTLGGILGEFRRSLPELYDRLQRIAPAGVGTETWEGITPVTIDVGIMERGRDLAVIPCDLGWSDIGSWAALHDILPGDSQGNVLLGGTRHIGIDTSNCLINGEDRLIATVGLEEMIVVDTGDVLLILPKDRAQDVSALVRELRARGLESYV
jgi:mannose-1-phosphate guanylyltransferase